MADRWFEYLEDKEYRRVFETPKFEAEVEDSKSIIERAFEQYRQAAELREQQEQARWEPDPMALFRQVEQELQPPSRQQEVAEFERATSLDAARQRFRQVEQDLQPGIAEFESAVPTAEQVVSGFAAGADRLRERVGGLGIERLAAERPETAREMRIRTGTLPAEARAGFAYEPEQVAHKERLTQSLREGHPDWSEEQLQQAATGIQEPGEGFMEMAAWGLAMRPAFAAMAATSGKAAAPVARAGVAEFERMVPTARQRLGQLLTEEAGGGELPAWRQAERGVRGIEAKPPAARPAPAPVLEEAPAWELGGMGSAQEMEQAVVRGLEGKRMTPAAAPGATRAGAEPIVGRGTPPPPRKPPVTAEAAGGTPPEAAGNRFVAPLREFDDVVAEVVPEAERALRSIRTGKPFASGHADIARTDDYVRVVRAMREEAQIINAEGQRKAFIVTGARQPTGRYTDIFTMDSEIEALIRGNTVGLPREPGAFVKHIARRGLTDPEQLAFLDDLFKAPAPKPAAQAFREATEPRAFQEAPAWELGGMGSAQEMEQAVVRGLEGKRMTPAAAPGATRAGAEPIVGRGTPPPPRKPPVTAEAAGGTPPEAAGNRFVAPLREFDDVVAEVVTSENPVVRALVGRTGINPSVLNDTPVGRALTAYWRQSVSSELLSEVAISPAVDVHAQMFTGRMGRVLKITPQGEITSIRSPKPGQSRMWQDVFSRPGDYTLPDELRAYIDDYLTVVRETEAMRVAAGLKPRAMRGEEGWFYVPRQVKEIRGVELRRPSNPGLQRIYEEAQEGAAAGVRYSDNPRATLELHVRSAYREVAEAQLSAALEPLSLAPKGLIREPIRIRMEQAVTSRVAAERQLRAMNRDYLKAAGKGKPGWPKREAGLAEMRTGLKGQKATVEAAKQEYFQAKKAYSRAMEAARKSETAPGNLFGQAEETIPIASWRNRFFPRDQADLLNETLGSFLRPAEKINPFARGIEVAGNYSRFLKAVGDFAMPFIQGLPTLTSRPWVWARMTVRHYQAWFDPTVQARLMRQRLPTFQKMAQHYTPIGDPEFFAALQRGGGVSAGRLVEMLPKGAEARALLRHGGKQTFGRFQASYNTGLASNRALLYESLQPTWKGTEGELWQHIRNMTGGLDSRAIGVGPSQRGFESVWLAFSPRLLRSTAALITDAARPNTPQGQAALKALAGLCSFAAGTYVLTGLSLGKSWEEIGEGLNPLKGKKFLSHEINGDWIGIGGQVRAITQFMAQSLSSIAPGGEPIENFISRNQFENPLLNFYSSRGAPALNIVGGLVEAGTGLNALPFEQVDSGPNLLKHIQRSVTPFALQGWLEGEQWGTTIAALVGARTSPETVYEERNKTRNEAAQRMFGRDWEDLLRGEQNDVREANLTVRELETEATELGAERDYDYSQRTQAYRERKDEMGDEGERALASDPTGREWASWRKTAGIKLNTTWEELTIRFGIEDEPQEPEFIEDRLAERFWNLELDTNNDGLISGAEYSAYDAEREAILGEARAAGVDEEYILHGYRGQMWPNHPRLQAIEEEYQQAKEIAHEYYSIPAKIGMSAEQQDRAARNAGIAQAIATQQSKPFLVALLEMGLPVAEQDEAFIYYKLPANPKRKMYRYDYPEEWELFKRFYSDVPLSMAIEEPELEVVGAPR